MAHKLISEDIKLDIALVPQSLNGAGTGPYYKLDKYRKALFAVELGAMAAGATSAIQVMQAQDAAGTGAKAITNNAATITANTKVSAATITCTSVVATDAVVINGLTYTAAAAADLPKRVFAVGQDDTECAASLAAAINHSTAGVPGVTATSSLGVVTLVADDETTITMSTEDATMTLATTRALGFVECDASFLDDANGFGYVAVRVTNSAAMQTSALLIRGHGRYSPVQAVAASKTDVQV